MTDERLRALERQTKGDPTDAEARHALLVAQVRAGHVTAKDAQAGLVNALRALFLKRMTSLLAVPLGPLRVGEGYHWPEGLSVGEGVRRESVIATTHEGLLELTDGELRTRRGHLVVYDLPPTRVKSGAVHQRSGEGWLWLLPDGGIIDGIVHGDFSLGQQPYDPDGYVAPPPVLFRLEQHALDGSCYRSMRTRVWLDGAGWRWEVLPPITRQTGVTPGYYGEGTIANI